MGSVRGVQLETRVRPKWINMIEAEMETLDSVREKYMC